MTQLENLYIADLIAADREHTLVQDLELRRRQALITAVSRFGGHTRWLPALLTPLSHRGDAHPIHRA